MNWKRFGRKRLWPIRRSAPNILRWDREYSHEHSVDDSRSAGRGLNWGSSKYTAGVLTTLLYDWTGSLEFVVDNCHN